MVKRRRRLPSSIKSFEFFKVFLPHLSSQQLRIPPAFIKHFNGSIPNNAILKDHTGKQWHVRLEEGEQAVFLTSGWQSFTSEHSLELGDFLVFNYDGNSHFDVKVFGINGCKKEATSSIGILTIPVKEEPETEAEETSDKFSHARKQKYSEKVLKRVQRQSGSSGAKEVRLRRTGERNPEKHKSLTAHLASMKPQFVTTLTRSSKYSLHIPKSLVSSIGMKLKPVIMMCDQNGKKWPMKVSFWKDGRIFLTTGWIEFWNHHKLVTNDHCVFEFVLSRGCITKEMQVKVIRGRRAPMRIKSEIRTPRITSPPPKK